MIENGRTCSRIRTLTIVEKCNMYNLLIFFLHFCCNGCSFFVENTFQTQTHRSNYFNLVKKKKKKKPKQTKYRIQTYVGSSGLVPMY